MLKIANAYGGAFLCDGVGLGKTFIGMMLLERLVVHDRQRVVLIVPKAARKDVWESTLKTYCPSLMDGLMPGGSAGELVRGRLLVTDHGRVLRRHEQVEMLEL